jgi:NADH-quinone oxidoreductase subunit N
MNIESFYLMRHELLLTLVAVLILIRDIFGKKDRTITIRNMVLILFSIVTVVGFLPAPTGTLFGGMYQTSFLHIMLKNVLNIGALLVFILPLLV